MAQNLVQLQRIQCDLNSGITALGLLEHLVTDEPLPNRYSDSLYVIHTYMQTVSKELAHWVQNYEQGR